MAAEKRTDRNCDRQAAFVDFCKVLQIVSECTNKWSQICKENESESGAAAFSEEEDNVVLPGLLLNQQRLTDTVQKSVSLLAKVQEEREQAKREYDNKCRESAGLIKEKDKSIQDLENEVSKLDHTKTENEDNNKQLQDKLNSNESLLSELRIQNERVEREQKAELLKLTSEKELAKTEYQKSLSELSQKNKALESEVERLKEYEHQFAKEELDTRKSRKLSVLVVNRECPSSLSEDLSSKIKNYHPNFSVTVCHWVNIKKQKMARKGEQSAAILIYSPPNRTTPRTPAEITAGLSSLGAKACVFLPTAEVSNRDRPPVPELPSSIISIRKSGWIEYDATDRNAGLKLDKEEWLTLEHFLVKISGDTSSGTSST